MTLKPPRQGRPAYASRPGWSSPRSVVSPDPSSNRAEICETAPLFCPLPAALAEEACHRGPSDYPLTAPAVSPET
jgi:hypothetical protein